MRKAAFRRRTITLAVLVAAGTMGFPGSAGANGPFGPAPAGVVRELRVPAVVRGGVRVRRPLPLPIRTNLVALSWRSPDPEGRGVSAFFLAHTAEGWSAWTPARIDDEEGPDAPARGRVFTQPVWVGSADRLRLLLITSSKARTFRDVRVHLINTSGDATEPNFFVRAARAVGSILASRPAQAATSTPFIIKRSQWGANERIREQTPPHYAPQLNLAFVHHTAGTNSYSRSRSDDIVRAIYLYHVRARHFRDIAYNFLIDRYGRIFEGRWGGIDKAVIGAHAMGFNSGSTGISLMGNFASVNPPSAMITALKRLLAWKLDVHHIPALGTVRMVSAGSYKYPRGRTVSLNRISGHRDAQLTSCPGARVYRLLPTIRRAVDSLGRPKIYVPNLPDRIVRPDGDGADETFDISANFSSTLSWTFAVSDRAGKLVRSWTGRATSMSVSWNGTLGPGLAPAPTGVYVWRLTARNSAGPAREASGSLALVTGHPDGTVLRDSVRRAVLENGRARPLDGLAWRSTYPTGDDVSTGPTELAAPDLLDLLSPVPVRAGTLLRRTGDGAYFVFTGGAMHPIDGPTFAALGYKAEAAIAVSDLDAASRPQGDPITDASVHPDGTAVVDSAGVRWVIDEGMRRPLSGLAFASRYRAIEALGATPGDLALPVGAPMPVREGTLLKLSDGTRWIVSGGVRRQFASLTLYAAMGYRDAWALEPSAASLAAVPVGPVIG